MTSDILIGEGTGFRREPEDKWREELATVLASPSPRLEFMTRTHHLVRDTVVTELPRYRAPLPPALIADKTALTVREVEPILAELEAKLFFLTRNATGAVSWAYPVTVEPTPHRLQFSTGESIYAA